MEKKKKSIADIWIIVKKSKEKSKSTLESKSTESKTRSGRRIATH